MFTINSGGGFQIRFSNGLTISVQFGMGHYCDNKGYAFAANDFGVGAVRRALADDGGVWQGSNAEIAVFMEPINDTVHAIGSLNADEGEPTDTSKPKMLHISDHDTVEGWVSADSVGRVIGAIASLPKGVSEDEATFAIRTALAPGPALDA